MSHETVRSDLDTSWFLEGTAIDGQLSTEPPHDLESDIVTTVVEQVSELTDQAVLEISPLYDTVDPGAIADLLASSRRGESRIEVSFSYETCQVTISSTGTVVVKQTQ